MAYTVAEARARARKRYPDFEDGTTFGLDLCQEALDELLFEVPLIKTTETLSALVAGTATYTKTEATLVIWEATYLRSANQGDFHPLKPTTQAHLDKDFPGWKRDANGTPERILLDANDASPPIALYRLWPTPDTSSTGSPAYPRVELTVTKKVTLTAGDTLPNQLKTLDPLIALMFKRFSWLYKREDFQANDVAAKLAIAELQRRVEAIPVDVQPEIRPFWVQQGRAR